MWHESTPSHIDSLATTICCENSWMDRCKMFYSNHITITTGTQLDISSAVLACLLLNSFLNWNNVQSLQLQEHSSMMWQVVYLHMDRNADAATCRMPAELCSLIPHCFMFIAHFMVNYYDANELNMSMTIRNLQPVCFLHKKHSSAGIRQVVASKMFVFCSF